MTASPALPSSWLPRLDAESGGPLYRQIAEALRSDIVQGALRPGDRIPPQRDLADRLGVTLGTVTRALREVERWGLLDGQVGRGTFVRAPDARSATLVHPLRTDSIQEEGIVDFGLNIPLTALDPDLAPALRAIADNPSRAALLAYPPAHGLPRHREAGADFLHRHDITCEPDEVTCCAGAQHAILVALGAAARPGDTIVSESLAFPGLRASARMLGIDVHVCESDDEGPVVASLRATMKRWSARAVYATPTLHNPTNRTWSEQRRQQVVDLCRELDVTLVEDEAYRLLVEQAPTPMCTMAPERTYFIGSMSKAVAGGLRVAYLRSPAAVRDVVGFCVSASTWTASPLTHEVAATWLDDGTADAAIKRKRTEARARQALAIKKLPLSCFVSVRDSHHLWLELPEPWTPESFTAAAKRQNVLVCPASVFAMSTAPQTVMGAPSLPNAVRISLGAPWHRRDVERGLDVLAGLLDQRPSALASRHLVL